MVGSQPQVAVKPVEQQVSKDSEQHLLSPDTISVNEMFFMYKVGLRNPTGERPLLRRSLFTKATMAANTGVEAEVPKRY